MNCPICDYACDSFQNWTQTVHYHSCPNCLYIFKDPSARLNAKEEKARYLTHRNRIDDPEYIGYFERFLTDSIRPFLVPKSKVLDFGSGPEPVLAHLLRSKYDVDVAIYDPFFAVNTEVFDATYDIITCTEVIEHLIDPYSVFQRFSRLLHPGGYLAIMTRFHPENERDFLQWFYPRDITHIGFFAEQTFAYLAQTFGFTIISTNHINTITLQKDEEKTT
jgi:SAM-dependent methyltransferase